ncbi:glycine zipper family protein [Roseovarius sp. 2305UL8-3]|uniref:glycine zipper family protein n=1 Tax=Roseovarius conchicola TaxID=3121636 RepID=UPI0035285E8B
MYSVAKIAGVSMLGLFAAGCSNTPYEPIVDGPRGATYQNDLAQCRTLSTQKPKTHEGATAGAVIGGLAGAEDDVEGVVAGAVIGGLIGSAADKSELTDERDVIVFNCMRGRGHNVVG